MSRQAEPDEVARFLPDSWQEEAGIVTLVGGLCPKCGGRFFPRRDVCPHCGCDEGIERVSLAREGRLYTYSVIHAAPKGFDTPYAVGYVDLDDGVRVFAQLEGGREELAIDARMAPHKGTIMTRADGTAIVGFKFRRIQP